MYIGVQVCKPDDLLFSKKMSRWTRNNSVGSSSAGEALQVNVEAAAGGVGGGTGGYGKTHANVAGGRGGGEDEDEEPGGGEGRSGSEGPC
jgi:hypothetical protein